MYLFVESYVKTRGFSNLTSFSLEGSTQVQNQGSNNLNTDRSTSFARGECKILGTPRGKLSDRFSFFLFNPHSPPFESINREFSTNLS